MRFAKHACLLALTINTPSTAPLRKLVLTVQPPNRPWKVKYASPRPLHWGAGRTQGKEGEHRTHRLILP